MIQEADNFATFQLYDEWRANKLSLDIFFLLKALSTRASEHMTAEFPAESCAFPFCVSLYIGWREEECSISWA
jgi:hypothetical protein